MIDTRTAPYAALLLRLALGAMFIAHSLILKVSVYGMEGTVGFFESIGYPGWFAWITMLCEAAAGVALILGVWTRLVAFLSLPILIGAMLVHIPNGWMFGNEGGGWEYPAFLIVVAAALVLLGGGAWALRLPSPFGSRG